MTFTGAIPAGAEATVDLELETTELAAEQPDGFVVTNTVESQVTLGEDEATGEASDDFTLLANEILVGATKTSIRSSSLRANRAPPHWVRRTIRASRWTP